MAVAWWLLRKRLETLSSTTCILLIVDEDITSSGTSSYFVVLKVNRVYFNPLNFSKQVNFQRVEFLRTYWSTYVAKMKRHLGFYLSYIVCAFLFHIILYLQLWPNAVIRDWGHFKPILNLKYSHTAIDIIIRLLFLVFKRNLL